ncbi:MAG TPA: c-type cytochrome [Verrucomicrobiae bacterium]|jgi:mono/diheme cytochrome c family protein|nr:c-type cytochrome [Verrucomicrobiae bacterium]
MRRCRIAAFALMLLPIPAAFSYAQSSPLLHDKRQQASDLEVGGALAGLPPGSTRYLTRAELAAMPQTTFTATGDTNFTEQAKIRGVRLEDLARRLAASPSSVMVLAICDDRYLAGYPRDYLAAHHPVLVLGVNGQPPDGWPKAAEDHTSSMGPYMISNPAFAPAFKVLSHSDEAQIPWGVVRLEFRDEKAVLGAIAPRGPHANDSAVQEGYRIAAQNCFRCHNEGSEGGQKSGRPWDLLGGRAAASPKDFAAYVRSPAARNPGAQMPANPEYDDATLAALTAYFRTFAPGAKP